MTPSPVKDSAAQPDAPPPPFGDDKSRTAVVALTAARPALFCTSIFPATFKSSAASGGSSQPYLSCTHLVPRYLRLCHYVSHTEYADDSEIMAGATRKFTKQWRRL
ncbi:hypothetical protein MTO96_020625 [Rhipicephalus appendiculatus]